MPWECHENCKRIPWEYYDNAGRMPGESQENPWRIPGECQENSMRLKWDILRKTVQISAFIANCERGSKRDDGNVESPSGLQSRYNVVCVF